MSFIKLLFVTFFSILIFSTPLFANGKVVHVNGYTKKDGTYVSPHYRTSPDNSFSNNWSSLGNINPYTGKLGTKVAPPSYYDNKRQEDYLTTPTHLTNHSLASLLVLDNDKSITDTESKSTSSESPEKLSASETFQQPTWCIKAKTTPQKMVCQDKNLSASAIVLDDLLSNYKSSHTSSEIEKINNYLILWEKNLFRKCDSVPCLEMAYYSALNDNLRLTKSECSWYNTKQSRYLEGEQADWCDNAVKTKERYYELCVCR